MNSTGFVRKVDDLGRVVIPKEIRKKLKISDNSPLEIFSDSSSITIKKVQINCTICGSKKNLNKLNDKFICDNCIETLAKLKGL